MFYNGNQGRASAVGATESSYAILVAKKGAFMEFITPEIRRRCLEAWERAVETEPLAAYLFGPPSWLVLEGQKVGESFLEAAERVKGEWFSDRGHPTVDRSGTVDKTVDIAETVDINRGQLCDCGHVVAPQRKKCWACIKRGRRR